MTRFALAVVMVLGLLLAPSASRADAPNAPMERHLIVVGGEGGLAYASLFGVGLSGWGAAVQVGAQNRRGNFVFEGLVGLRYEDLETTDGITIRRGTLEPSFRFHWGRGFVGLGPDLGLLVIDRISATPTRPDRLFVGVHAELGAEVVSIGPAALHLGVRGTADWVFKVPYFELAPYAGLDVRL